MPEDLYDDGGGEQAPMPEKPRESGGKTALLPKHCFPDAKPGDKLSVNVVRVHEDEIEVEPECHEDKPGEEVAEKPESGQSEGGPMTSMLED